MKAGEVFSTDFSDLAQVYALAKNLANEYKGDGQIIFHRPGSPVLNITHGEKLAEYKARGYAIVAHVRK